MEKIELKCADGSVFIFDATKLCGMIRNPLGKRDVALVFSAQTLQLKLGEGNENEIAKLDSYFASGADASSVRDTTNRNETR